MTSKVSAQHFAASQSLGPARACVELPAAVRMVRARQLATHEQEANASVVQLEKGYIADLKEAEGILKRHPAARNPCVRWLHNCGWTLTSAVVEAPVSVETKARRDARKKVQNIKAEEKDKIQQNNDLIPTMYSTVGSFSAK
eukprot:4149003-Amphidinium_carterae.1